MSSTSASTSPPPPVYTQGHSRSVLASHQSRTVQNSASFLLPHLPTPNPNTTTSTPPNPKADFTFTLVDLGCGPGTITQGFSTLLSPLQGQVQVQVIGIDASASVIDQARSSFPAPQYPNLDFRVGDVTARLPFADDSVDVVFTNQTLLHIPDPGRVVREAYRILRPDGGMLAMREAVEMSFLPGNPGTEMYVGCLDKAVRGTGAAGFQAGRMLHVWAGRAGFDRAKMQIGAGGNCYAGPGREAKWWAGVHVERLDGEVGKRWLDMGVVSAKEEIDGMKEGLALWGEDDEAWASVMQGEVICWK